MKYIINLAIILFCQNIKAQDQHFSQFYAAPLALNPALTGMMPTQHRFSMSLRQQWFPTLAESAYYGTAVSYDQHVPVGKHDWFGIGVQAQGSQAGAYQRVQGDLSVAYGKQLGREKYLIGGGSLGVAQRQIHWEQLHWGSQFDGRASFNPNLTGETDLYRQNKIIADVGMGLVFYAGDATSNYLIGAAIHHLNRPNIAMIDDKPALLYWKWTVHGSGTMPLNRHTRLITNVLAMKQGASFEINGGTALQTEVFSKDQMAQLGLWLRGATRVQKGLLVDALIIAGKWDWSDWAFGVSYDVNLSSLNQSNVLNNAIELSLMYRFGALKRNNVWCPTW